MNNGTAETGSLLHAAGELPWKLVLEIAQANGGKKLTSLL